MENQFKVMIVIPQTMAFVYVILTFSLQLSPTSGLTLLIQLSLKYTASLENTFKLQKMITVTKNTINRRIVKGVPSP